LGSLILLLIRITDQIEIRISHASITELFEITPDPDLNCDPRSQFDRG